MTTTTQSKGRVLIADDEAALARGYARWLDRSGYSVEVAHDGAVAAAMAARDVYDVIVSDIAMPGMTGMELLRSVRDRKLQVPFVLMTAHPAVESAIPAVELGALRYLIKPIDNHDFEAVVEQGVRLHRLARLKQEAQSLVAEGGMDDQAEAFDRALAALYLVAQPIVCWSERRVRAYEMLMRSREPSLPHPGAILGAAERLGRLPDLGRAVRSQAGRLIAALPAGCDMFINLHSADFLDESLYDSSSDLGRNASRVVLEVTERESLDGITGLRDRVAQLRGIGYRIAVDDLGAGYAGLSSFTSLEPDVVKLDMSLVRNIHEVRTKRTVVTSLAAVCRDLGMEVVAEGVETPAERDTLAAVGCDLLQGYHFARPAEPFAPIDFPTAS